MDEDRNNLNVEDLRLRKRQQERRLKRKREKEKMRRRKRIILIVLAMAMILLLVFGIASCVSSCVSKSEKNQQSLNNKATEATQVATVANIVTKPTQAVKQTGNTIKDNGKDGYETDSGIYIWDNKAFEQFYGTEDMAKTYANAITHYRQQLDSSINVYNLVVPTHIAFGLPDRLKSAVSSNNQQDYLNSVFSTYGSDIKSVNIYDTMDSHKTEYEFFNTDHHWTADGSYYAYEQFCKVAGETPVDKSSLTSKEINGFVGSLYTATNVEALKNNPDTVKYYDMGETYTMYLMQQGSTEFTELDNMYYEDASAGSETYGVFIWGDNPVTKIVNADSKNGKKILVIKESYGNAFVPWLVNNYDEVHAIDFRHYDGNVVSYCKDNGITDVLFLNGVMSSASSFQIDSMSSLFA